MTRFITQKDLLRESMKENKLQSRNEIANTLNYSSYKSQLRTEK